MSELTQPTDSQPQPVSLVIVGAGMSGLNALTVARKYLPAPAHEIVIADERADFGGHWNDAYDFVRLHQPYRNYTSFDEDWALKRPPTYLATRDEVLHHFRDVGRRGKPCTLFDHRYIGHSVVNDDLLDVTFERLLTEEKKGDSDNDKCDNDPYETLHQRRPHSARHARRAGRLVDACRVDRRPRAEHRYRETSKFKN